MALPKVAFDNKYIATTSIKCRQSGAKIAKNCHATYNIFVQDDWYRIGLKVSFSLQSCCFGFFYIIYLYLFVNYKSPYNFTIIISFDIYRASRSSITIKKITLSHYTYAYSGPRTTLAVHTRLLFSSLIDLSKLVHEF